MLFYIILMLSRISVIIILFFCPCAERQHLIRSYVPSFTSYAVWSYCNVL